MSVLHRKTCRRMLDGTGYRRRKEAVRTFETELGEAGAITLPDDIVAQWSLRPGDDIEFYGDGSGSWFVRPLNASPTAFFDRRVPRPRIASGTDDDAIGRAVSGRLRESGAEPAAA